MKINKRILIVDNVNTNLYIIDSIRHQFDQVIEISDYLKPLTEVDSVIDTYGRLPSYTYDENITKDSKDKLKVKLINKVKYVKIQDLDFGSNNAYFVVGKLSWYYIRDFHSSHVGLRNTNLDWQIVHLKPFSMGTNKFVFCHSIIDEHYKDHSSYFFNDKKLLDTVSELKSSKILKDIDSIKKALNWAQNQPEGTRFGLDYETNGLWRNHKYEDLLAIGVGISTKKVGFYIELRYLDEQDLNEFKEFYKSFLDKHHSNTWVFNIDFEMIVTRKLLGSWAIYEFKDADVWRVIYGDQIGYSKKKKEQKSRYGNPKTVIEKVNRDQRWSLKYTAQKYLNVPSWDNDFEAIERKLSIIFEGYKLKEVDDFLTNPILSEELHRLYSSEDIDSVKLTRLIKKLGNPKKLTCLQDILDLTDGLNIKEDKFRIALLGTKKKSEIVKHPLWKEIITQYKTHEKEFLELLDDPRLVGNQYAVQPSEIVGEYCILDSYYTVMIAEKEFQKDSFSKQNLKNCDADWVTTEKVVEIFNSNKSLGAMLNMYGLYKNNTKRDHYNDIQERTRIFYNYILAKGYYKFLLHNINIKPHPNEKLLNPTFVRCIERGLDPTDFNRITKTLFQEIYDDTQPHRWNDTVAIHLLGTDLAQSFKDHLLDSKPKGFVNPSAYSRSLNIHKTCGLELKSLWESQNLPKDFEWEVCKDYYEELSGISEAKNKLKELETFNIKDLTLEEVLKLDKVSYTEVTGIFCEYSISEALTVLKKQFFDVATANEVRLGQMFEQWKPMRILFTMYGKGGYKNLIDEAGIFEVSDDIDIKVSKFNSFVSNLVNTYEQPELFKWEDARIFAIRNKFSRELRSPRISDMEDALQQKAYIDKVLSQDVYNKYKITKKFLDDYMWYFTIDETMMKEKKEWLLKYNKASPLSYRDKMLDKAQMCSAFDTLLTGKEGATTDTEDKLRTCNISDTVDYSYYPILATCFKLYRKYDKLGQYLNGQLVDNDYELLGEDEDGVPRLANLTKDERHAGVKGNKVKMFPRYEIMQKATKRNSSGIHTVPGSSEVKGIVTAPEDSLLVYTDISSMELRGIAAISKDQTMIDYFESGKDIYTEAAMAYHVDFLKKDLTYDEVRRLYRNPYKIGVISTIYTASDPTLAKSFGVEVYEVREIKNAIFKKFTRLYEWQQEQVEYNKSHRGFIKTFLGDIRKTYDKSAKQTRQAVNMDVQGSCSLVATAGFRNIITEARKKKMYLAPAVIVHDAIVAYSKAKDIEELYDHYQASFYDYLDTNYGFRFPLIRAAQYSNVLVNNFLNSRKN